VFSSLLTTNNIQNSVNNDMNDEDSSESDEFSKYSVYHNNLNDSKNINHTKKSYLMSHFKEMMTSSIFNRNDDIDDYFDDDMDYSKNIHTLNSNIEKSIYVDSNKIIESINKDDALKYYYINYDELHEQMEKNNIYKLDEGTNNDGPMFEPTAKLYKCRSNGEKNYKLGKHNQRWPSWCDRILYKNMENINDHNTHYKLKCINYDFFEEGKTMTMSDHAGVIGEFLLEKEKI
jgi:hypothetical protein